MTEPPPGPPAGWVPPPPAAPGPWAGPVQPTPPGPAGPPDTTTGDAWRPPPSPAGWGSEWPAGGSARPRRQWESAGVRRDVPLALAVAVVVPLLGIPAGLLWHRLSARPKVLEQPGGIYLDFSHDDSYFGISVAFAAVTLVAGLLVGAVVWALSRGRGPAVPVGLAVGSLAASLVARAVGERPVTHEFLARSCPVDPGLEAVCTFYAGHLRLDAPSALLVWAVAALAAYLLLTAAVDRPKQQSSYW